MHTLTDGTTAALLYPLRNPLRGDNKTSMRGASQGISYKLLDEDAIGGWNFNIATQERNICDLEIEIVTFIIKGSVKLTVPPDRQK